MFINLFTRCVSDNDSIMDKPSLNDVRRHDDVEANEPCDDMDDADSFSRDSSHFSTSPPPLPRTMLPPGQQLFDSLPMPQPTDHHSTVTSFLEAAGQCSVETLLVYVQGLVKIAAESARHREHEARLEKCKCVEHFNVISFDSFKTTQTNCNLFFISFYLLLLFFKFSNADCSPTTIV